MNLRKTQSAFTLIEIMIVVVIIAVLALMAGPRIIKLMGGLKVSSTKATISALKGGIERYHQDMGTIPKTLDDLLENPGGRKEKFWDGPYIDKREIPVDGWNNEFEYHAPPTRYKNYRYYELYSLGDDEVESDNDIEIGE